MEKLGEMESWKERRYGESEKEILKMENFSFRDK